MRREQVERERTNRTVPKIVHLKTKKEESKEAAFAERVQEKNHERKQEYEISFIVYLLWMLGINLLLDYQLQDPGDRLGGIVLWLGMILWVSLFTERFYQCYFTLLGEQGELTQNILTVVRQFPFSVGDYGKYVRKQLRFWQRGIFCGTVVISVFGLLIFIRNDFYPVFLWETQDGGKELVFRILGIFILALLMAVLPDWIFRVKLAAAQRNHKKDNRYFHGAVKDHSRKGKQRKKWLLICLEILLIIFFAIFHMIITEWIHPVSRDGVLFIQMPNLVIFAIILLMESVRAWYQYLQSDPETTGHHQERVRQRRKVIVPLCIGMLLFLLPQFYYDIYYENRMETRHFITTKSYEWQDVVSYEIYCPVWGQDIQLKLYMKDGSQKRVFKTNANYSEKYYSEYTSDYVYIEKMVERLDALGVEGSLEDAEKIGRKIDRSYEEDWEAWKKIRERVEK